MRFFRLVSAWVIVSFLGSLIICCELFSSSSAQAAEPGHTEVVRTRAHDHDNGHAHDHGASHDHSLSPFDGQLCASKYLPKFINKENLGANSFDDKPFIGTFRDDRQLSSALGAQAIASLREPHTGSPPLYMLFHRLLIAHLLA